MNEDQKLSIFVTAYSVALSGILANPEINPNKIGHNADLAKSYAKCAVEDAEKALANKD